MWPRYTLLDLRTIAHYLGVLILFGALIYAPSILLGVIYGEWEAAGRYLFAAGINVVVGNALRFVHVTPARLTQAQAIAITALSWVVLALLASIPLFLSGHYAAYIDAIFDGVSGFTTTGACLVQDIDHLSNADNMFRFSMTLVGALGLVVVALSMGIFGKGVSTSLYTSEARSEHVLLSVVHSVRLTARIAVGFVAVGTVVLGLMCLSLGMESGRAWLHALWLSITSFMTGGFTYQPKCSVLSQ